MAGVTVKVAVALVAPRFTDVMPEMASWLETVEAAGVHGEAQRRRVRGCSVGTAKIAHADNTSS